MTKGSRIALSLGLLPAVAAWSDDLHKPTVSASLLQSDTPPALHKPTVSASLLQSDMPPALHKPTVSASLLQSDMSPTPKRHKGENGDRASAGSKDPMCLMLLDRYRLVKNDPSKPDRISAYWAEKLNAGSDAFQYLDSSLGVVNGDTLKTMDMAFSVALKTVSKALQDDEDCADWLPHLAANVASVDKTTKELIVSIFPDCDVAETSYSIAFNTGAWVVQNQGGKVLKSAQAWTKKYPNDHSAARAVCKKLNRLLGDTKFTDDGEYHTFRTKSRVGFEAYWAEKYNKISEAYEYLDNSLSVVNHELEFKDGDAAWSHAYGRVCADRESGKREPKQYDDKDVATARLKINEVVFTTQEVVARIFPDCDVAETSYNIGYTKKKEWYLSRVRDTKIYYLFQASTKVYFHDTGAVKSVCWRLNHLLDKTEFKDDGGYHTFHTKTRRGINAYWAEKYDESSKAYAYLDKSLFVANHERKFKDDDAALSRAYGQVCADRESGELDPKQCDDKDVLAEARLKINEVVFTTQEVVARIVPGCDAEVTPYNIGYRTSVKKKNKGEWYLRDAKTEEFITCASRENDQDAVKHVCDKMKELLKDNSGDPA